MQKYTVLKDAGLPAAASEVPLINGHTDSQLSEQEAMDNMDKEETPSKDTPTLQHYTNKANIAKLQWWNTPTPRLTLDAFKQTSPTPTPTMQNGINSSNPSSPSANGVDDLLRKSFEMQNQSSTPPQQLQTPRSVFSGSAGADSPLSKSASSSRHRLNHQTAGHAPHHHQSSSSVDNASPRIRLTNQFSIEEEPDPNKQDSQLLLNGKWYSLVFFLPFN